MVYPYLFPQFTATVANHATESVHEILLHSCQSALLAFLLSRSSYTIQSLPFLGLHDIGEVATLVFRTSPLTALYTVLSFSFLPLVFPRSYDALPSLDRHSSRQRRRRLLGFYEHRRTIPHGVGVVRRDRPLRPSSRGRRRSPACSRNLCPEGRRSRALPRQERPQRPALLRPRDARNSTHLFFSRSETPTPPRRRSP